MSSVCIVNKSTSPRAVLLGLRGSRLLPFLRVDPILLPLLELKAMNFYLISKRFELCITFLHGSLETLRLRRRNLQLHLVLVPGLDGLQFGDFDLDLGDLSKAYDMEAQFVTAGNNAHKTLRETMRILATPCHGSLRGHGDYAFSSSRALRARHHRPLQRFPSCPCRLARWRHWGRPGGFHCRLRGGSRPGPGWSSERGPGRARPLRARPHRRQERLPVSDGWRFIGIKFFDVGWVFGNRVAGVYYAVFNFF